MRTHYCIQMSGLIDWINILSSIANPNLLKSLNVKKRESDRLPAVGFLFLFTLDLFCRDLTIILTVFLSQTNFPMI